MPFNITYDLTKLCVCGILIKCNGRYLIYDKKCKCLREI